MTESTKSSNQLTLVETFELSGSFTEYETTVKTLCRRIEQDGLSGVRSMQHYTDRQRQEAYVILNFEDGDVFDRQVEFIRQLDELAPFADTVKLKQIKAFGDINEEMAANLCNADFQFDWAQEYVTGFVRSQTSDA